MREMVQMERDRAQAKATNTMERKAPALLELWLVVTHLI